MMSQTCLARLPIQVWRAFNIPVGGNSENIRSQTSHVFYKIKMYLVWGNSKNKRSQASLASSSETSLASTSPDWSLAIVEICGPRQIRCITK